MAPVVLAGTFQQVPHDQDAGLRHRLGEQLQSGKAVVHGTMRIKKETKGISQELQFGTAYAISTPVDVLESTGPRLACKEWKAPLEARTVESGVVGDDQLGIGNQCLDGGRRKFVNEDRELAEGRLQFRHVGSVCPNLRCHLHPERR